MDLRIEKRRTWFGETAWCCCFEHKGKKYYADLTPMPSYCMPMYASECMIFDETCGGKSVYCRQSIPVTKEALVECIEEFIAEREVEERKRENRPRGNADGCMG